MKIFRKKVTLFIYGKIIFMICILFTGCVNKNKFLLAPYTDSLTGIIITFEEDEESFPSSWKESPSNGKSETLDIKEKERTLKCIKKALKKYPISVLKKNLSRVCVFKSLEFYGVPYGGTNSENIVYLTNDGRKNGYTDEYIEQTFHHEFSSILLTNYTSGLDKEKWEKINTKEYGDGGIEAIRNNENDLTLDEELMQYGLLSEYASSDFENDFNTFAENIFCPNECFWGCVNKYPKLNQKVNMITEFYSGIDKSLSERYFLKINLTRE